MKRFGRSALGALPLALFASSALAQPVFAPRTAAEVQANLTAERLAAVQRSQRAPVLSSDPAMTRLDKRFASQNTAVVPAQPMQSMPPASPMPRAAAPAPRPLLSTAPNASRNYAPGSTPTLMRPASGLTSGANVIPAMPDARAGECFALVRLPERFHLSEREYEVRAASERIETTPPTFEDVIEQYVVQEAYERVEVMPASFRMVTERVEVAAPSSRYEASEPVYETITERVLEQPARTVWKLGRGPIERVDHATGDIMCLVEEPALYKNITRRVLKQPAEARQVSEPGQYTLVSRRVLERPAEVRRVVVPEQLGTRTVRRQVSPGTVQRVAIPAQRATTTVRELAEPARLEWRSVLCETNMTPANIRRVQAALAREGFNPGPADGRLNAKTLNALNDYQRARNLPEDRYLNMDTVRALGVM